MSVHRIPYFISNSLSGKNFLVNTYGLDPDKVTVIRNGLLLAAPVDDRATWRRRLNAKDEHFLACMVANLHRAKDHATLIHAWAKVVSVFNDSDKPPILLLAGRFDGNEHNLKKLVHDMNLYDYVKFLGKIDDVSGLLNAVDVCVHSSKSEGCPNAILEAMATGLPVVGTDIPGIRDVIHPEGYMLLAAPGDPESLAECIMKVYLNKHIGIAIGKSNSSLISSCYSLQKMCEQSCEIIEKAIK